MGECIYRLAWKGRCGTITASGDYCEEHLNKICESCGKKATHQCEETSQFVCGAPLCDDCVHTTCENGTNTGKLPPGLGRHCRKTEQVYKPWYERGNFCEGGKVTKE